METVAFDCSAANGQVWSRDGLFRCIRYDSGAASGGVTPTIRIRSLVGQAYDCELVPGRQVTIPDAARGILVQNISGGAVLTGKITLGAGQVTDNSIVGEVSLNAAALAALEQINVRPEESTTSYFSNAVSIANTAQNIFSAGSNVNGAILLSAQVMFNGAVGNSCALIAKATAPANCGDGEVLLISELTVNAASVCGSASVFTEQAISAGKGLWFISEVALGSDNRQSRTCRYILK